MFKSIRLNYFSIILIVIICSCNQDKTQFYNLSIDIVPDNSGKLNIIRDTLIKANDEIEIKAISNDEFVFVKWEGSINSSENPLMISMNKDETLIANFTKRIYPLNITIKGNGGVSETIVKTKTDYESGATVRLVATADEGWVFQNWSGDISSEDDTIEVLMDKELNLTANFVELETFCVPISLESYNLKSDGDSVKILDYSFDYDGRFLTKYRKEIDYLRNGEFPLSGISVSLEYRAGNMVYSDHRFDGGVREQYTFIWDENELEELRFLHTQSNGSERFISDNIEYNSECGLSYFEGKSFQDYGGVIDTSYYYIDYSYENDCKTYGINVSNERTTFDNASSIFIDVQGRNGFIGANYEALISEGGIIPNYNPGSLRIGKTQELVYRDGMEVLEEETYKYYNFLDEDKYPQYFTRDRKEKTSGDPVKDSFVVNYSCFQTPGF